MVVLASLGSLELRLATARAEIDAAQALRYRVFYEEMGAPTSPALRRRRRDVDAYDRQADHLLVVDTGRSTALTPAVVGCYRLILESVARRGTGFYTGNEFDLSDLAAPSGQIMELGRSCVDAGYRDGAVIQLLWKGIAHQIEAHQVGLMLGCASLRGTDPDALALPLSWLHHRHLAPPGMRPRALPGRHVAADRLPPALIDGKAAMQALPPLLKGYLRLGGMIGEGAVIDHALNTIDVCLVLPTAGIKARYQRHYALDRPAAAMAA